MMNQDPLYLNWEFWGAIVAALALVLSQLPPIPQLLRRAKLAIEVYPGATIWHFVGYPCMQLGITLSNSGGREVKIKKITVTISREGAIVATLPAQLFSSESEPTKQLLFIGFKIKPDEDRSNIFNFYLNLPRNQERDIKEKTAALRSDQDAKKLQQPIFIDKNIPLEADPAFVQPFHDLLVKNFIWIEGEYVINIRVDTSDSRVFIEKAVRLTLFESDSKQLRNYEAGYKYGEGIYYGIEKQALWVRMAEG
jgi:hypothetical protein